MPSELLIRPARQDNLVISDLIAPGGSGRPLGARPPISRLVVDAPLAAAKQQLAEDARGAGLPYVVDPQTYLLQGETDPDHAWSQLPFACAPAIDAQVLHAPQRRQTLIRKVVEFQLEHGASVVVPPYFQASGPGDPWFKATLRCLTETAEYLRSAGIRLPLYPALAGRADRFARPAAWIDGIDLFASTATNAGVQLVAMQIGPSGAPGDNYAKVLRVFEAALHLRRPGLAVHAWRQGVYGPALVASGACQGYETGITSGEKTDLAALARSRRPKPPPDPEQEEESGGGGGGFVFVPQLGRSIPGKAAQALRGHRSTQALLLCDDSTGVCCPSLDSTLTGPGRRKHAVRSRARYLSDLERMPAQASWRLNKVARDAEQGARTAELMNKVLRKSDLMPLNSTWLQSLAAVAQHLQDGQSAVA